MKRKLLKALTLIGCFSTGIIYGSIGVIAILSFLKLKQGGADENSFFVLLDGFVLGRVLNWIIILGAVCFVIWRFYEAIKDPNKVCNETKGILLRTGIAFSSLADALIAFSVLQALFSQQKAPVTGEPVQQQSMVADLLKTEWGRTVVFLTASILLLTALVLAFYGLSKRFTENIKTDAFTKRWTNVVHGIAYAGYLSRGVILGVVGFFFLKSAIKRDSSYVVNTDKAFDFIGDNIGGVAFLLIATGTICYGLYMFILGLYYNVDAGKNV
jgi:NADH:ubiquinone oxidoreductase subunit 6 (subunit J)